MITATFTDPQGTNHTDAVFHLRQANRNKNESEYYALDTTDFTTVTNPDTKVSANISFSVYYWVNAAAKENGAAPYILANSADMSMDFNFVPDETYDGLSLEQKCEKYLTETILPGMQP
ncbi:hypothetical protein [Paraglaciecola sp.]|uniref:hypothetical protein n=1 Tax=Paraglaciecola sp. TaxID=1920173 RepID=UPI003EF1FF8B